MGHGLMRTSSHAAPRRDSVHPRPPGLLYAGSVVPFVLCVAAACAGPSPMRFDGPTPPAPENIKSCKSLCEKAACPDGPMAECQSDCERPRNEDLNCEPLWSRYLACLRVARDVSCTDRGYVVAPACAGLSREVVACEMHK